MRKPKTNRTRAAALLGAAVLVSSCARAAEPTAPPSSPPAPGEPAEFARIPKSHPRLLVGKEAGPRRLSINEFRKLAPKELLKRPVKRKDPSVHALRYILAGKDEEAAAAVALLKVRGSMHYQKIDLWLPQYALAYDWIHDWKGLAAEDRATIEENILAGGRACLGLTTGPGRQVFHNSYAQMLGTLGMAGLALFDRPEGRKLLATAVKQYETEWMAAWDYKGGAVHEGASYAPEFAKPMYQFLAAYTSATGRDMFSENEKAGKGLSEFLHWMDWIERPDGTYSREGDIVTGWRATTVAERAYLYDLGDAFLFKLAAHVDHPSSKFLPARARIVHRHGLYAYREDNLAWAAAFRAIQKADPMGRYGPHAPPVLPPARLFGRGAMGFVVMRSGRGEKDAHLTFHCGDHFGNHQHFDQGHFAIFAGGAELAIDNGYYSKYGGPHFKRYWKSSWAHNTVCVRRENAKDGWTGEQRHLEMKECFSVADYKQNRLKKFETGDLLGFKSGMDWAWASGDASKAYPVDVLKKFVRQIVYLKDASALIVYDEVTPARKADRPVFLVQCVKEPIIDETHVRTLHAGQVLDVQPILPAADAVKLEAVHGPDVHGKKIWEGARKSTVEKLGAWRVEVSRKDGGPTRFLVVLSWGEMPAGLPGPLPKVELLEKDGRVGVRLAGAKREVLFDADPAKPPEVRAAE